MKLDYEYGFGEMGLGSYFRNVKNGNIIIFQPDLEPKELARKIAKTKKMQKEVLERKKLDYVRLQNTFITI